MFEYQFQKYIFTLFFIITNIKYKILFWKENKQQNLYL
jgi:hypothetical protein